MSLRVLLCDDHPLLRASVRSLLEPEPDLEVVGEAATGVEALEQVAALAPDVVVMDVEMPGMNGMETTRQLLAAHPRVRVLALSLYAEGVRVQAMVDAGASGYVAKPEAYAELAPAIRSVAAGQRYFSAKASEVAQRWLQQRASRGEL